MANKFLNQLGVEILWSRIKTFLGNNYVDNSQFATAMDTVQEYVDEKIEGISGGTLPSQLDIYCGNSNDVMD